MPRPPKVQYDDVARSCVRIISKGKHPSIDAIYDDLGRIGSRSTIHKHRQTFLEQFERAGLSMLPSALPEALIPVFEDLWSQAILHAGKSYQEHEAGYESRISDLELSARNQEAVIAEQKESIATLKQELRLAYQEKADANKALREAESTNLGQKAIIDALRADKDTLNERLATERKAADRRYDLAQQDWVAERAAFKETIEALKKSARESEEKQNRLTDYWTMQVADARDQVTEMKQQLREAKEAHQADLSLERTRIAQLTKQADRLTDDLERLRQQLLESEDDNVELRKLNQSLNEELDLLKPDLEQRRSEVLDLRKAIEVLERKNSDLSGKIADLGNSRK
ncbi:DNA-binding protein [Marinobacter sp. tcs-11]|uniref:DNA-binding protein n=1 Tax=Marinobacter sp. tcs-11 TaxID=1742860 RepID=UPI00257F658F|nr:DNA-binding protein [Marinobacter sp. tcs-11]